ncbi:MAG: oxygen-independent coproporphyrinogen III oxidase [Alphaproteobacteria bacterium]|nr:oxygen-independent coproporphyrinogen III oxidase [Alphaproteobacteria bacterium]
MSCALKDQILTLDQPVPRYTSYPTAPHFEPAKDASCYQDWLEALPASASLSLYVHVPYCSKLCWYCGCHTKITRQYDPVAEYVQVLLREIELVADHLPTSSHIDVIHFGGGSPGMVSARDFDRIMNQIRQKMNLRDTAEISIELDPRGVTEARVATYARHGVNRISLGVQDFDEKVLKHINRPQPFHLTYQAVQLLHQYDIQKINFDLLYGLPFQTIDTMNRTLDQVICLNPNRVSLFGYAHVPWMKKHMRLIDESTLPQKDLRYDLFETGSRRLIEAGYMAIGMDHFAKPDDPLAQAALEKKIFRNFQGYTDHATDAMIGIGASSISHLPQGYVQNKVDQAGYRDAVLQGRLPVHKQCHMDATDALHADIIERIMCDFGVNLKEMGQKHAVRSEYFKTHLQKLKAYQTAGFVSISEEMVIKLSPEAKPITRLIASVFDHYLLAQPSQPRHARAI